MTSAKVLGAGVFPAVLSFASASLPTLESVPAAPTMQFSVRTADGVSQSFVSVAISSNYSTPALEQFLSSMHFATFQTGPYVLELRPGAHTPPVVLPPGSFSPENYPTPSIPSPGAWVLMGIAALQALRRRSPGLTR